ncbi:MAG: bifunctional 5,10-methylenetetrahydrofolate dehydrogenase/5,10-methenyltetrahydrofolate cyclohydrolase [Parcubacteria group bacterium]|nr:bifunctional 5,10-methylenetetrahydrofolate dehydrogenase/5,10-methenyltetrahydrofolate cyclohydrolase [Parcubacteria group bacterium]
MLPQEANRLAGTEIAAQIQAEVAEQIKKLKLKAGLAVILVGNDPASEKYVSLKQKAAQKAGIDFHLYRFGEYAAPGEILQTVRWLNEDPDIHAILIQLPLPEHLDEDKIIAAMDYKKDVDGFHPKNIQATLSGAQKMMPGLVMGIVQLITATGEALHGKQAAIIARHEAFVKILSHALSSFGATPVNAQPGDPRVAEKTQKADIVITAVGKPGWLTGDMIKEGCILIDVGTSEVNGTIAGDAHKSCKEKAAWISPVPGGVGPMTVAMLLKNTALLARLARRLPADLSAEEAGGGGISTEAK